MFYYVAYIEKVYHGRENATHFVRLGGEREGQRDLPLEFLPWCQILG